jgi:hypothetical protein
MEAQNLQVFLLKSWSPVIFEYKMCAWLYSLTLCASPSIVLSSWTTIYIFNCFLTLYTETTLNDIQLFLVLSNEAEFIIHQIQNHNQVTAFTFMIGKIFITFNKIYKIWQKK